MIRLVTPLAHLMRLLLQAGAPTVHVAILSAPVVVMIVETVVVVAVLGLGAH